MIILQHKIVLVQITSMLLNLILKKHVMQRVKTASILNRFQLATRNSLKRNSYTNTKSYDTGSSMINLYEAQPSCSCTMYTILEIHIYFCEDHDNSSTRAKVDRCELNYRQTTTVSVTVVHECHYICSCITGYHEEYKYCTLEQQIF